MIHRLKSRIALYACAGQANFKPLGAEATSVQDSTEPLANQRRITAPVGSGGQPNHAHRRRMPVVCTQDRQ